MTPVNNHCTTMHWKTMYETSEESKVNCDQRAKCKSQISSVQQTSEQCAEAMIAASWSIWIAAVGPIEVTSVKNMPPSYTDTLVTGMAQPTLSAYSAVHTVGACIVFSQIPIFCTFYLSPLSAFLWAVTCPHTVSWQNVSLEIPFEANECRRNWFYHSVYSD